MKNSRLLIAGTFALTSFVARTLDAQETILVSRTASGAPGNSRSLEPSLSGDGGLVTFRSGATDLVPGDDNRYLDIFVLDRKRNKMQLVSVSSDGGSANGH